MLSEKKCFFILFQVFNGEPRAFTNCFHSILFNLNIFLRLFSVGYFFFFSEFIRILEEYKLYAAKMAIIISICYFEKGSLWILA